LVIPADAPEAAAIWVGPETTAASALRLHPPCLAIGVGCRRGVPGSHILTAINATLDAHGLSPKAAALVCSIDAKTQEPGLHEAARSLDVPFRCFPPDVLSAQPAPHPSARVYQHMGVSSVCEAAALASHPQAELRIPKTIHGPVTVAVAQLPCGWWDSDLETQAFCPPSPETP
jgi:cobalamin biosynthesis protein CbiG